MDFNAILMQLWIAFFAGSFIGLQREMRYNTQAWAENVFIGIRSSIFLAVIWVVSTFFTTMPYLPVVMFSAVFILLAISHTAGSFKLGKPWITSELIGILIFWIWALIGLWLESLAIILTVILTSVNTFRGQIDNFIDALSHKEWLAALQLFVFSGAVLPILPNMPVTDLLHGWNFNLAQETPLNAAPYLLSTDVSSWWAFEYVAQDSSFVWLLYAIFSDINLFKVWLFVLFISWISFIGYFLSKFFWAKWGIPIAAFLWALSSSTAVTVSLASQEKDSFKQSWSETASLIFVVWILVWVATMMLRVILGVFVIGWMSMWSGIFLIPLSMSIAAAVLAIVYMRKYNHLQKKNKAEKADIKLSSPFEIWPAITFAWLYVLISVFMNASLYDKEQIEAFIVWLKLDWMSENLAFYTIAFISGFADVDAIYIKVSDMVKAITLDPEVWVITITIAVIMNTLVKILYVKMWASKHMSKTIGILVGLICLIGSIVTLFVVI